MNLHSTFTLQNGVEMPLFGLGAWRAAGGEARDAVAYALRHGYRLVDTAAAYENEEEVGEGVRASGLSRGDVFVTSKVWNDDGGYNKAMRAFEKTLARLGFDTLDLYLIHWPIEATWRETWRALEELYRQKRVRAIGVSNFPAWLLAEMQSEVEIMPMVNQVQFHPLYVRRDILDFCRARGILVQAWSPLARGRLNDNEVVARIAANYGKTSAQVLLRWELQLGLAVIPKSVHAARIEENAAVFGFALSDDEMAALTALDKGESVTPNPPGVLI